MHQREPITWKPECSVINITSDLLDVFRCIRYIGLNNIPRSRVNCPNRKQTETESDLKKSLFFRRYLCILDPRVSLYPILYISGDISVSWFQEYPCIQYSIFQQISLYPGSIGILVSNTLYFMSFLCTLDPWVSLYPILYFLGDIFVCWIHEYSCIQYSIF